MSPKLLTLAGPLLKRVFRTNAFTTVGGLVCVLAVILLAKRFINAHEMLEMLGIGGGIIGFAAKDGTRLEPVVAPESLTAPDVPASAPSSLGTGLVVLMLTLVGLTACSPAKQLGPATDVITAALAAPRDLVPNELPTFEAAPDSIDLPPALAHVPEAPYLAAPPAHLSKRERRQFLRAQRRALVVAARTTPDKIKLTGGSAYAAPDGTAVALRKANAPVAAGANAATIDQSKLAQHANGPAAAGHDFRGPLSGATTPPKLSVLGQVKQGLVSILRNLPQLLAICAALAVIGGVLWVRFGPLGSGIRAAALAARSRQNPTT